MLTPAKRLLILKNNLSGLRVIKYKQTITFGPQSNEKQTKGLLYEKNIMFFWFSQMVVFWHAGRSSGYAEKWTN